MRHPALLAFCSDQAASVTDEIVDLFDEAIAAAHGRAKRKLIEKKLETATSQNQKVRLLAKLLEILLDPVQRALAPLESEGWRLRHSLPWQGRGDIDSIAIAPTGFAFTIETKTRTYTAEHLARVRDQTNWLSATDIAESIGRSN